MIEAGGGHIVNFASVAGVIGLSQSAAYAASKGGVIVLTARSAPSSPATASTSTPSRPATCARR